MRVAKRKRPRLVGVGAVGAVAAGFGGVQSAEAAIVHQPVGVDVPPLYSVDLGGDAANEFDIQTFETVAKVASFAAAGTGVVPDPGDMRTANLAAGTLIGPASIFSTGVPSGGDPLNGTIEGGSVGHFNGTSGFIGVQFLLGGNTHYGYVEYTGVADQPAGTVHSIAWEDAPDTAIEAGAGAVVAGDFDGDGDVDGADFVVWQTNFPKADGGTLDTGDADGDGDVDGADFVVWQTNFPFTPSGGVAPVPEPTSLGLLAAGAAGLGLYRLRRRSA